MEYHDCPMHDICIPVPGMPGKCTMPAKCEQCINDRMNAVEHENALLDADIEEMRKDIDAMKVEMDAVSRDIDEQSREISEVNKVVGAVLDGSAMLLQRAASNAVASSVMIESIERMKELVKNIKAAVT